MPKSEILSVRNLSVHFGGTVAVENLNLEVFKGEIVSLIGPNGAGKSTTLNVVSGFCPPTRGEVFFQSELLLKARGKGTGKNRKPSEIARLGIARTFQNLRLFSSMTVLENILVSAKASGKSSEKEAYAALSFFGLKGAAQQSALSLPYGLQRRLELCRALVSNPALLLLDEPCAGMNPKETKELSVLLSRIRREKGITILLIEHHMELVRSISDRIYVLDFGKLIAEGEPKKVLSDPSVINAYLGKEEKE